MIASKAVKPFAWVISVFGFELKVTPEGSVYPHKEDVPSPALTCINSSFTVLKYSFNVAGGGVRGGTVSVKASECGTNDVNDVRRLWS